MTAPATGNRERFDLVVGLEVHVQLRTRTKAFCRCATEFGAPPNSNVCPVCLGMPGALPVLNARVVDLAVRAALALGCDVHPSSVFARKHYFYPDLPKGYQISQFDQPLATGGSVTIGADARGTPIRIGLTRIHIEEDAGKSVHDRYAAWSAVDLNRAGVPLIEIVSEPHLESADAARAYCQVLKQILDYTAVSDVSMERGSLRVDANVSIRPRGQTTLGTKTEVKNMNSFAAVHGAIEAEFARQCALVSAGGTVEQQTLLWDAGTGTVRPARSKEGSHDYRYFPDPDLPPLLLESSYIETIRMDLPELPAARAARFGREYPGLTPYDIDLLTSTATLGDYFEQAVRDAGDPRTTAGWVMGEVLAAIKEDDIGLHEFRIRPADLAQLLSLVRDGVISRSAAKQVFGIMRREGGRPADIVEREGLVRVADDAQLATWIDDVFAEHPDEARRFLGGEQRLQGVLVGFVMRRSGGSADPRLVNQMLVARAGG